MNCPKCGNELEAWSKKKNFWMALAVGIVLWPVLLVAMCIPFFPKMHTCKNCKKTYKDKDLKKMRVTV